MAIPDAGLAHKSTLSLGKEAVPGTPPAAADVKMEIIDAKANLGVSNIRSRSMNPTIGSPRYIGNGPQQPTIDFTAQVNFQGLDHLWRAMLGGYASALVGAGPGRDHTHKEGTPVTNTVDLSLGDIPTGKVAQLVAGRLVSLSLKGEVGSILEVSGQFAGTTLIENVTPMTAASIVTADGIQWDHAVAANIFDGSGVTPANIPITGFEISAGIPHKTNRGYFGALNPARPLRVGNNELTWMFNLEFGDDDLMTKARAGAAAAGGLELLFRGSAITGGFYELSLKASSPKFGEFGVEIPNFDITTQSVRYGLQYNASDASALVIRTRNEAIALV